MSPPADQINPDHSAQTVPFPNAFGKPHPLLKSQHSLHRCATAEHVTSQSDGMSLFHRCCGSAPQTGSVCFTPGKSFRFCQRAAARFRRSSSECNRGDFCFWAFLNFLKIIIPCEPSAVPFALVFLRETWPHEGYESHEGKMLSDS